MKRPGVHCPVHPLLLGSLLVLGVSCATVGGKPGGRSAGGAAAVGSAQDPMSGVRSREGDTQANAEEVAFARACFADYADFKARWLPYETKHREALEGIKGISNHYERLGAVSELAKTIAADAREAELAGASWIFAVKGRGAYALEAYLAEQHRHRKITRVKLPLDTAWPPMTDELLAGDVYCNLATTEGTHRLEPLSYLRFGSLLPETRAKALHRYSSERLEQAKRDLAPAPTPAKLYTSGLASHFAKGIELEPGALVAAGGILQELRTTEDGVEATLQTEVMVNNQHDCITTNKVERIRDDGTVEYQRRCKSTQTLTQVLFRVRFVDVPVQLAKGDWADFDGLMLGTQTLGRQARTNAPTTVALDIEGTVIRRIARAPGAKARVDQYKTVIQF
jgi:hypothetical protein